MRVFLTVDVEPDCPPFLNTFRGVEEGLDPLLDLLSEQEVKATFFTTGEVAERFPAAVAGIASQGHELGCHGQTHRSFASMDRGTAKKEIIAAAGVLRRFGEVISFRAPYLNFPGRYLDLLVRAGFLVDSSLARYKPWSMSPRRCRGLVRVPVSAASSVLRLPSRIRDPFLGALRSPVVLYVHPWEFVDLRRERIRLDCRFKTGPAAFDCLKTVIELFKQKKAVFSPLAESAAGPAGRDRPET